MTQYTYWSEIAVANIELKNSDVSLSPTPGNLVVPTDVTMTHDNPEADIYYTIDGSTPTVTGTTYSGAFSIFRDVTDVGTIAHEDGWTDSDTVSGTYTWDYYTSVLFQSNSVEGNRSTTDLSYNNHATSAVYNTDAKTKWGTTSFYVYVPSSYYFGVPNNADINFSGGDFTIEGWFNTLSYTYAGTEFWKGHHVFGGSYGAISYLLHIKGASSVVTVQFSYCTTGNTLNKTAFNGVIYHADGVTAVTPGEWFHLAISRVGTNMYLHVDGNLQAGLPYSCGTDSIKGNTDPIHNSKYGPKDSPGIYIDDFRIVKGKGLYSANFTAPTAKHEPDDRLDY